MHQRLFQTKEGVTPSFQGECSIAVFISYSQKRWLDVRSTDSTWRRPVHASVTWGVLGSNPDFLPDHHTLFTAVRGAVPPLARGYRAPGSKAGTSNWGHCRMRSTCGFYKSALGRW